MIRRLLAAGVILLAWPAFPQADEPPQFSRIFIYDVRGAGQDETGILVEQTGATVKVWLNDYSGKRTGSMPLDEYLGDFNTLRGIRQFALKKEYQGRLQRGHAARGTITLAWKDSQGKQIKTIRYYAPEHTLDEFRNAFNHVWAMSRYAILSLNAFESSKTEYLEDALSFLAGSGWTTGQEVQEVVDFLHSQGKGPRLAAAVWAALDRKYSSTSEFRDPNYLADCVIKGMVCLGEDGLAFLDHTALHPDLVRRARAVLLKNKK
jgi:hypothetical protein